MIKEELMEQMKAALEDESVLNELKTLETPQDIYGFLTKENLLTASYEEFIELSESLLELLDDNDLEGVTGGTNTLGEEEPQSNSIALKIAALLAGGLPFLIFGPLIKKALEKPKADQTKADQTKADKAKA